MIPRIALLGIAFPCIMTAQSMVEYGLAAGTAIGTAAAMQHLGDAVSKKATLPRQENVKPAPSSLPQAGYRHISDPRAAVPTAGQQPARPATANDLAAAMPAAPAPAPAVNYEDPNGIQEGMDAADVERRFGPPGMKMSSTAGGQLLCYSRGDSTVDVELRDGKVVTVKKSAAAQSSGAIVLR